MVDFHSHILPGMDDGAKKTEDSLALLHMTKEQRISAIVATPHFYADREKPDNFCQRRYAAAKALAEVLPARMPKIYIGAEVAYFGGIGRSEQLKELCILGTKTVLVEMPFSSWSEAVINDLRGISDNLGLLPVIAHIERYIGFQNREMIFRLLENGVRIQSNAEYFTGFFSKRKAISMLAQNQIQFIGSDCHNTTTRAQNMRKAMIEISKRIGREALEYVTETSELQLSGAVTLDQLFINNLNR